MLSINKTLLLFGVGLFAFVVAGIADAAETALNHQLGRSLHLGLGLAALALYFYGVAKLSQSKRKVAVVTITSISVVGYVSIVRFLFSFSWLYRKT